MEVTAQQVDSSIAFRMDCVRVNNIWKLLHSWLTVELQVEWSLLQCILCGCYCTAVVQSYCNLNGVCNSEHYLEITAQQVDCLITS